MKPHYAWANSASVRQLETPAPKRKRQDDDQPKVKTCEQYVNKDGKTCYHGNKNLRRTENLNLNWPMQVGFCFLESDWLLTLYFLDVPRFCQNIANPSHHLREYPVRFGFKLVDMSLK